MEKSAYAAYMPFYKVEINTVKPVYKDHQRKTENMVFDGRWSL